MGSQSSVVLDAVQAASVFTGMTFQQRLFNTFSGDCLLRRKARDLVSALSEADTQSVGDLLCFWALRSSISMKQDTLLFGLLFGLQMLRPLSRFLSLFRFGVSSSLERLHYRCRNPSSWSEPLWTKRFATEHMHSAVVDISLLLFASKLIAQMDAGTALEDASN